MNNINITYESLKSGTKTAFDMIRNIYNLISTLSSSVNNTISQLDNKVDIHSLSEVKNTLYGNYIFGLNSSNIFSCTITEGSYIEHYGRISKPNDIVNVAYLQKATNPILIAAKNAIQRNSDTIGLDNSTPQKYYNYLYKNCNINFGSTLYNKGQVNYYGPITDDYNIINKKYATDMYNAIMDMKFFAHWHDGVYGSTIEMQIYSGVYCPFYTNPIDKSSNFDNYFEVTSTGLKALKPCMVRVEASGIASNDVAGDDIKYTQMYIKKNGIEYDYSFDGYDGATGGHATPTATSVIAIMNVVAGDIIVGGFSGTMTNKEVITLSVSSL